MQDVLKSPLAVGVISFVLATGFYLSGAAGTIVMSGRVLSSTDSAVGQTVSPPAQVGALVKSAYIRISEYQRLEFRLSTRMDKLSKRGVNIAKLDGILGDVRNEIDTALTQLNSAVNNFTKAGRFTAADVRQFVSVRTDTLRGQFARIDTLLDAALTEVKILEKSVGN